MIPTRRKFIEILSRSTKFSATSTRRISASRIEYKFLDDVPIKQTKDKLEKKLNRRARNGWRVAERGTTLKVITLQRPVREAERTSKAEYLILSSRRAPGLARSLEDATNRGLEFVRLFVEPDETTVLLEKVQRVTGSSRTIQAR